MFNDRKSFVSELKLCEKEFLHKMAFSSRIKLITLAVCLVMLSNSVCSRNIITDNQHPDLGLNRIVNGNLVPRGEHTYMAHLEITIGTYLSECGATIIDELHLITAAHCFIPKNNTAPTNILVMMRGYSYQDPVDPAAVFQTVQFSTNAQVHEGFNLNGTMENDIAIIKLDTPIDFDDEICVDGTCYSISTIDLPNADSPLDYAGQTATYVGWGTTKAGTMNNFVLRTAQLPLVTPEECLAKQYFHLPLPLPGQQHCSDVQNEVSVCPGDSGGPLLIGNTQIGFGSFADFECNTVNIFTNLVYHVKSGWIASHL